MRKLYVPSWFPAFLAIIAFGSHVQGAEAADTGNVLAGLLGKDRVNIGTLLASLSDRA
jgi:hypothetical protein